jgi:PAS domain-containing protein
VSAQRPLELILARNLLSSISTPAFLLGEQGVLLFYNDSAAAMLGRGLEETANLSAREWTREFGPLDADGRPLDYERLPAVLTVRGQRPYHGSFRIRAVGGTVREVQASAIPIIGLGGSHGAIVFFWAPERALDETARVDGEAARVDGEAMAR